MYSLYRYELWRPKFPPYLIFPHGGLFGSQNWIFGDKIALCDFFKAVYPGKKALSVFFKTPRHGQGGYILHRLHEQASPLFRAVPVQRLHARKVPFLTGGPKKRGGYMRSTGRVHSPAKRLKAEAGQEQQTKEALMQCLSRLSRNPIEKNEARSNDSCAE